ncbi:MAG: NAD(P)H-hydrate dehydratase [Clostridia bacterium]|nr:NAD(P)H-hydrate dehydratase [Clostridia bacterium]
MQNVQTLGMRDVKRILGERKENSHKGDFGYVGLVGGSPEYSGAIKLASLSCCTLRSGVGVSKVIVPRTLINAVMPFVLESTLYGLPEKDGYIKYEESAFTSAFRGLKAVTFGMGLGQKGDNLLYLEKLLSLPIKLIIDADGLNTLAAHKELLVDKVADVILTPHIGEFSRLSGLSKEEILGVPEMVAKDFASRYGVTLILKDATSVITDGRSVFKNISGTVGMATAGSGDVLSGILVGLSGYLDSTLDVACAGAFINGLAGEITLKEEDGNPFSMLAGDTALRVGKAISAILQSE